MNIPIIVSTQYSSMPAKVEVYIDNELIFKDGSLQTLYRFTETYVCCGYHQLKAIVDNEEFIDSFLVFPVRWIYIEVQKNEDKNDEVFIQFSFSPIVLM